MPRIHPTASVDPGAELADDVTIGPHCVITTEVRIGAGTRLLGNAWLHGPLDIGPENLVYPFACLGFAPQSVTFDPKTTGRGLVVGRKNVFREGVTIHRAMTDEGPTTIGDENFFMANSHAGHDTRVGSHCVIANGALLAGHVEIGDRVTIGGNATVHQFCRIGRGAMLSGSMGVGGDLAPWFMLTGINVCGSINLVGLRRNGFSREEIDDVRWVYRTLYRRGLPLPRAVEALQERIERPLVAEYVAFCAGSRRGLCPGRGRAARSTAGAGPAAEPGPEEPPA